MLKDKQGARSCDGFVDKRLSVSLVRTAPSILGKNHLLWRQFARA